MKRKRPRAREAAEELSEDEAVRAQGGPRTSNVAQAPPQPPSSRPARAGHKPSATGPAASPKVKTQAQHKTAARKPQAEGVAVGTKVAKLFSGWGLYVGTVVKQGKGWGGLYHIVYEDGEEEDMTKTEVSEARRVIAKVEAEIATHSQASADRSARSLARLGGAMTKDTSAVAATMVPIHVAVTAISAALPTAASPPRSADTATRSASLGETHSTMRSGEQEKAEGKKRRRGGVPRPVTKPHRKQKVGKEGQIAVGEAAAGAGGVSGGNVEGAAGDADQDVKEAPATGDDQAAFEWVCSDCHCDFTSRGGLKYHVEKEVCKHYKWRETPSTVPGITLECPTCKRLCSSANSLRYHLDRCASCLHMREGPAVMALLQQLVKASGYVETSKRSKPSARAVEAVKEMLAPLAHGPITTRGRERRSTRQQQDVLKDQESTGGAPSAVDTEDEDNALVHESYGGGEAADEYGLGDDDSDHSCTSRSSKRAQRGRSGGRDLLMGMYVEPRRRKNKHQGRQVTSGVQLPGIEGHVNFAQAPPPTASLTFPTLDTDPTTLREVLTFESQSLHAPQSIEGQRTNRDGTTGDGSRHEVGETVDSWLSRHNLAVNPLPLCMAASKRKGSPEPRRVDVPPFQGIRTADVWGLNGDHKQGTDCIINACGPVYGLDMLVDSTGVFAAIGTTAIASGAGVASDEDIMRGVAGAPPLHVLGRVSCEPNLLQLWRVAAHGETLVEMRYALGHDYGPVWDLRWAPAALVDSEAAMHGDDTCLGVLGAVFGDGRLRVLSLNHDIQGGVVLPLDSRPLVASVPNPSFCLTSVRWCPHDPCLLVCCATDGSALVYRLDASQWLSGTADGVNGTARLVPARRLFNWRDMPQPAMSALSCAEWHPCHPHLLFTAGHEAPFRVWDLRKPFSPIAERSRLINATAGAWMPNGVGCLLGMVNGTVKSWALPDEMLRVRVYRHSATGSDMVTAIDTANWFKQGPIAVTAGQDGSVIVVRLSDRALLAGKRTSDRTYTVTSLMSISVPSSDGRASGDAPQPLAVNIGQTSLQLSTETTESAPTGAVTNPLRAGLVSVKLVSTRNEESSLLAVGGFSGCVAFVNISRYSGRHCEEAEPT